MTRRGTPPLRPRRRPGSTAARDARDLKQTRACARGANQPPNRPLAVTEGKQLMPTNDDHTDETPTGLGPSGLKLWRSIAEDFDLDIHEQLLLTEACRCADRLDRLDVEARTNEVTVINMKGDRVAHPALTEARQQAIVLSRLLASLRMPSGEAESRPQRRGASRAPYRPRPLSAVPSGA